MAEEKKGKVEKGAEKTDDILVKGVHFINDRICLSIGNIRG